MKYDAMLMYGSDRELIAVLYFHIFWILIHHMMHGADFESDAS